MNKKLPKKFVYIALEYPIKQRHVEHIKKNYPLFKLPISDTRMQNEARKNIELIEEHEETIKQIYLKHFENNPHLTVKKGNELNDLVSVFK